MPVVSWPVLSKFTVTGLPAPAPRLTFAGAVPSTVPYICHCPAVAVLTKYRPKGCALPSVSKVFPEVEKL